MSGDDVTELLAGLAAGKADAAWRAFLAAYSGLIMHAVRRHENDEDRAAECFMHVCAALSDDRFRRLRAFRPGGPASFRTWLLAVVSNLCVDWRRREQGRARPFRSIARLPELERQIYHCIFVRGLSRAQCLETLVPRFPSLDATTVGQINSRLFALLTPQQRWQLSLRTPATALPIPGSDNADENPWPEPESPGPGPDALAAHEQERERLQRAMSLLPADQRLLLRLRYEQELTLAEIARLTGQPDPFRVNRRIEGALAMLAELMRASRE
jgi:RNA polymerase sigma factor (sigma-70 family)